jgi:flagellar protein FliJ
MTKYRFRLDTLRKLRATHRDQQRAALADAYRADQLLADRRAELAGEQNELRGLQRIALASAPLDVNRLVEAQRYEMVLKANEQHLADQTQRLAAEVERRRQAVVEADRSVRVLELLDERQRREHRRRQQQLEIKQLDEMATMRRRGV